jgi:hypothetical protein
VRFGFPDFENRDGRNIGIPRIDVTLEKEGSAVTIRAVLDSGAEVCLFDEGIAQTLGIEITEGLPIPVTGIGGYTLAYAHTLTMTVSDGVDAHSFPCRVLFKEDVRQNLIGREDFFEIFRITFSKSEGYIALDQVYDPFESE